MIRLGLPVPKVLCFFEFVGEKNSDFLVHFGCWMTMGVDKNASDRKGKSIEPRKHRKGLQRRVMAVQNLYETCREVFANCGPGVVPSPENVERVKAILGTLFFASCFHFYCRKGFILDRICASYDKKNSCLELCCCGYSDVGVDFFNVRANAHVFVR